MTNPVRSGQATNSTQTHQVTSFSNQGEMDSLRGITPTNAAAVNQRHNVSSPAMRSAMVQSLDWLNRTFNGRLTIKMALQQWVNAAQPGERPDRKGMMQTILRARPSLQADGKIHIKASGLTLHRTGQADIDFSTLYSPLYPNLTSLPDNLHLGWLNLSGYNLLERLPNNLSVDGSIDLGRCTSLTCLPVIRVGEDLHLNGCTSLRTLPDWIFNLGHRSDGEIRQINLSDTNLSAETLTQLRQNQYPGIAFILDEPISPSGPQIIWENLPLAENVVLDAATTCSITLHALNELQQPVYLPYVTSDGDQQNSNGHVFELQALLEWYSRSPTHPINRTDLDLNQLQRVISQNVNHPQ